MEGEKETAEEEEEELHHHHRDAAASSVDFQDLPIMHWEELSERIAELEKQEQERKERDKRAAGLSRGGVWSDIWDQEDQEDQEENFRRCRVSVVTSRQQKNLQLCFINNSDSDEEEQGAAQKVAVATGHRGLKQEVVSTLRALRDQLLSKQREERGPCSSCASGWKHLDLWDLQQRSVLQLCSLRAELQHDVHALSSELVTHLLLRDQLRTEQDAMLLDVQDLT